MIFISPVSKLFHRSLEAYWGHDEKWQAGFPERQQTLHRQCTDAGESQVCACIVHSHRAIARTSWSNQCLVRTECTPRKQWVGGRLWTANLFLVDQLAAAKPVKDGGLSSSSKALCSQAKKESSCKGHSVTEESQLCTQAVPGSISRQDLVRALEDLDQWTESVEGNLYAHLHADLL